MIRPAKTTDVFEIVELLQSRYPEMRYAGNVAIDPLVARRFLAQCVQRHGGSHEGSTNFLVWEQDGINAFMLGMLSRVYHVGDALAASDVYLVGRKDCSPRAIKALIDGYLAWAESNPNVYEIGLSHADTFEGGDKIGRLYETLGFTECSRTYRRENPGFGTGETRDAA